MKFTKMHGLGNDFIIIDDSKQQIDMVKGAPLLAEKMCRRNFSVGGDGLVFIRPSENADFSMRIFNNDGSEAEMCGNAIRCLAKYVYDKGLTREEAISVETLKDIKFIRLKVEKGKAVKFQVDMGSPVLDSKEIPVTGENRLIKMEKIKVGGRELKYTAVSMGNPHCVIFVEQNPGEDLTALGALLERHPYFPNRTNVEFAKVVDKGNIKLWVFERGVGPTLACGTGACATVAAAVLNGFTGRDVKVMLPGGVLEISWVEETNRLLMSGPAEMVYYGELDSGWMENEL